MDKVANYGQIIKEVITEYASVKKTLRPGVRSELIIDRERQHYQLLSIGWHQSRFVYTVLFHFDIVEGKVWIQQNNTDVLIADELVRRGIAREDIVLGFLSEEARHRIETSGRPQQIQNQ